MKRQMQLTNRIDYSTLTVSQLKGKRDMLLDSKCKLTKEQQKLSSRVNEINTLIDKLNGVDDGVNPRT